MLIAGIGGGFAVYCGLPLATYPRQRGAQVSFANLSFTNLPACCCSQIDPNTWQITAAVYGLPRNVGMWAIFQPVPILKSCGWLIWESFADLPQPCCHFTGWRDGCGAEFDAFVRLDLTTATVDDLEHFHETNTI